MKILSIFIICLFFVACGPKSKKSSTVTESAAPSPMVSIAAIGNITGDTFEVSGTCSEEGQPVIVYIDGESLETDPLCTTAMWSVSVDVNRLLTGVSRELTITVDHANASGLVASQVRQTVTLYPRVGITAGLENITAANAGSFTVSGTCSENGQPVTVSVGDVSATATCTSEAWTAANIDVSRLLTGASRPITITVNHLTSGGLAATQASQEVTLAPRVGIATGLGNITGATFAVNGTCSEDGQDITVDVGGVSPATAPTCTSTGTWSVNVDVSGLGASGEITITANHSTSGGLAALEASQEVTLYPRVGMAAGLGNITAANAGSFTVNGTCSENGQAVAVSVGTVAASPAPTCSATGAWSVNVDVSSLLTGASREITITANHSTSGASPLNATQASQTVTLAPRVGIAAGLGNITEANAGSFTVNGTCSESGQAVTVSVGTVAASPAPTCSATGAWSVNVDVSSLLTGASRPITITANHSTSGSSPLAAAPASQTVTLAPRVGITATGLGNITEANAGSFTVSGTCSESGQAVAVSVGTVAASPAPTCSATGAWSVDIDVSSLLTGASREITITANHSTSGASPLAAAPASQTVTLAPRVGIAAGLGNITEVNAGSFTVNGTCSESGQAVTVSVGTVAASPAPTCSATGAWSVNVDVSSLLTGASREITITANHSTSGSNPLAAAQASQTVTLAPRVGITATGLGNITEANAGSFTVSGTCSESGQAVAVSVGTVAASPAPTCSATGAWSVDIDVSRLLTGASREITITANHSTSGSNPLAALEASERVTLVPRVGIAAGLGNITEANAGSFTVNGTCSESGQAVAVSVGDVNATATCSVTGTWSENIDVSSLTGASRLITITANHSTSDGLAAAQASQTVTLAPRVGIASGLGNITEANASDFTVEGTCSENGQPVTVSVGTVVASPVPNCNAMGIWSIDIDVSSLLTGASREITITANHSTSDGLAAAPASQTVTLAPRVGIASGLGNITEANASDFTVEGTCSENGQPVTVIVGTVVVSPVPNCNAMGIWSVDIDVSSLLTGASRLITITANHSTSDGLAAAPASRAVILAPRVGITAADLDNITEANASSFTVSGTCSENGQAVAVRVGDVNATATCTTGNWSEDIDVSSLLTGVSREITITANHSTSDGLAAAPASETVTLAPRVGITAAGLVNITEVNASSFTVRGTCSENGQAVTVRVGDVNATATCTTGAWSADIDVSSLLTGASREIMITANHSTSDSLAAIAASETVTLAPRVGITAADLENITEANASDFTVEGTCSENGQAVTVVVGGVSPVTAPTCTIGAWSTSVDVSGLTGASREIMITANHSTSGANPLDALEASETVTLAPRVGIDVTVGDITGDTFAVTGTCSENSQPVIVDVGGESPTTAPTCTGGTWSTSVDVSGLGASGEITITANHSTSGANPLDALEASEMVTLYPRVGIAADLDNITAVNAGSFTVSGTCSENSQPVIVDVGGESPGTDPLCTSTGTWSTSVDVSGLTGASREITITANHSTSGLSPLNATQASQTVTLYPRVGIATGLGNITGDTFAVNGTCSEDGQAVAVSVGGESPTTDPNCTGGTWSTSVDVSGLGASGEITITANHSTSGPSPLNATQASQIVTLYPRVGIDVSVGDIIASPFVVTGTCSENSQPVIVDVGGESPDTAPICTGGSWSTSVDVSRLLAEASGSITITADHSTSGPSPLNATRASKTVRLAPRVSIDIGSLADITSFNAGSFTVSGTCSEDGQAVTVDVGTVPASPAPTCNAGAWSVNINVSALSGTSVVTLITANHSTSGDPALPATPATANVLLNPTVSINTRALEDITSANAASFSVIGHCSEEGEPVEVSVGTASPKTDPTCTSGAWTVTLDVTELNQTSGTISLTADHSPSGGTPHPTATANVTNYFTCPENYVGVSALSGYTTHSFCLMKYEAKNEGSDTNDDDTDDNAVSQANDTPYVSIDRDDSIDKCTALGEGYDLITNDEWQSLARNIELVPDNWATGVAGNAGGLSRGHSDSTPSSILAANSDDNVSCHETGQTCDLNTWHAQRRTHTLSNGNVIWDVAGNVWEWVKDTNNNSYGINTNMSQVTATSHQASHSLSNGTTMTSRIAKDQFGPSGSYSFGSSPFGGLGSGILNSDMGGVLRGGTYEGGTAGIFSVLLNSLATNGNPFTGFRCTFDPSSD